MVLAAIVFCAASIFVTSIVVSKVVTPTITLNIKNDLSFPIEVSVCGSNPLVLGSGETGLIDPNPNDPNAACAIYQRDGAKYIGCLPIPTTVFHEGDTVRLKTLEESISVGKCGD